MTDPTTVTDALPPPTCEHDYVWLRQQRWRAGMAAMVDVFFCRRCLEMRRV